MSLLEIAYIIFTAFVILAYLKACINGFIVMCDPYSDINILKREEYKKPSFKRYIFNVMGIPFLVAGVIIILALIGGYTAIWH